jgi:hypothetical protein
MNGDHMAKTKKVVEVTPGDKIRQDISNLCTQIGDRHFLIRQANSDVMQYYAQIDALRDQLRVVEQPGSIQSGPETAK